MQLRRRAAPFAAAAFLCCAAVLLHAAPDPAKDFAALEEAYETAPETTESMKAFQPRYEAFAKANPGTEQALTAKLRLLEFTSVLDKDARAVAAGKLADEILAQHPRSEQLARIPEMWHLFDRDTNQKVFRALSSPDKPAAVKAALLLNEANRLFLDEQPQKADVILGEIIEKYRDVRYRWSTFGVVADALLNPHRESDLSLDMKAPEIEGKDVNGKPIKLSELKGRVVVLHFFGDWSEPCRAMYPHQTSLAEEMKNQKFTLLGVNSDSSPARAKAAFAREKIASPVIFDNGSKEGPLAKKWRVKSWPTVYLIDAKGVIRFRGLRDEALTKAVKQLLAEAKRK